MHAAARRAEDPARAAPLVARTRGWRALNVGVVVMACAFVALAITAHHVPYFPIDVTLTREVQSNHGAWLLVPLAVLSAIGFPPLVDVVIAVIIIGIFATGRRAAAIAATFGSVGIAGLNFLTKALVDRPRPPPDLVHVAHHIRDSGFPAGHVMTFTVFFGFLCHLVVTELPPSWGRTTAVVFLVGSIVAMGPARIIAGEHWPSDVLGGYLLGLVWLAVTLHFYRWVRHRKPMIPGRRAGRDG